MIIFCPHCGHSLKEWLKNGICSCDNCNRVFNNDEINTLLAAAWMVRRRHINFIEQLHDLDLTEMQKTFIQTYVLDGGYSHQDLLKVLKSA